MNSLEVLKALKTFVNEPSYTGWSDLSRSLRILSTLLSHTDFREEMHGLVKDGFSPRGETLRWDPNLERVI